MISEILLFVVAVCVFFYIFNPKKNAPPGPWGFPLLGSFPVTTVPQALEMQKKYGNLFMMRVGVWNFLYISDYKTAKEAYLRLEYANRPDLKAFHLFEGEIKQRKSNGIVFSNGVHWHHNRRFLLRHLRDLGMGKSRTEGIIMTEVENLVENFKSLTDKPSTIPFSLNISVLNIVWQLVSSHRYEFSDKKVEEFMSQINEIQKLLMAVQIPDFFPFVKYVVPDFLLKYLTGKDKFEKACQYYAAIIQPIVDEHVEKLDPNNPVDLMDDYLIEMKERKSEDYAHFNLTDLTRITFDLFTAGNDTTANMIRWVLTYMVKFPFVQKKIQEEIDNVVQRDSFPSLEHRDKLAYIDATINEVQRHCSMLSFGAMRAVDSDLVLEGYHIPQKTMVFSVAALSHRDPTYFKNPEEFDPSRFLDAKGKFIPTCDGFQAFGLGKRQCPGEQLARMELYLITAALLQTLNFSAPEDQEIDITPDDFPMTHFSKKQKFMINLRN